MFTMLITLSARMKYTYFLFALLTILGISACKKAPKDQTKTSSTADSINTDQVRIVKPFFGSGSSVLDEDLFGQVRSVEELFVTNNDTTSGIYTRMLFDQNGMLVQKFREKHNHELISGYEYIIRDSSFITIYSSSSSKRNSRDSTRYNAQGLYTYHLHEEANGSGYEQFVSYNEANERDTCYMYHQNGKLDYKTIYTYDDENRELSKTEYNDRGRIIEVERRRYDDHGNVIRSFSQSWRYGNSGFASTMLYKYDDAGNKIEEMEVREGKDSLFRQVWKYNAYNKPTYKCSYIRGQRKDHEVLYEYQLDSILKEKTVLYYLKDTLTAKYITSYYLDGETKSHRRISWYNGRKYEDHTVPYDSTGPPSKVENLYYILDTTHFRKEINKGYFSQIISGDTLFTWPEIVREYDSEGNQVHFHNKNENETVDVDFDTYGNWISARVLIGTDTFTYSRKIEYYK